MKILITGCAGFIGINFTKYWLDTYADDEVIGVDCLTYAANISALDELKLHDKFRFYKINICDYGALEKIFQTELPDIIINFAAESHVDRSIEDSRIFIETNVVGVQTLLDMSLKYGVKRFHQISTDEVYGDLSLNSNDSFNEDSPLKPSSPYSASKAAADLLVLSYCRTYGLNISISRSSNNYGSYQHTEKLIPKTIQYALSEKKVPIFGNGLNIRDWLNVKDHCCAIDLIVHSGKIGNIYNVGGGDLFSNISLVKEILRQLGKSADMISFVEERKGHDRKYALNCNKIKAELAWNPKVEFSAGLTETIRWYEKVLTNE